MRHSSVRRRANGNAGGEPKLGSCGTSIRAFVVKGGKRRVCCCIHRRFSLICLTDKNRAQAKFGLNAEFYSVERFALR